MSLRLFTLPLVVSLLLPLVSCTYLKNTWVQAKYSRQQDADPSMVNLKHMIDRDTYFAFGRLLDPNAQYANKSLAVVAFSSRYRQHELVDAMHEVRINTHYGLNLPPGDYQLVVFADLDADGLYHSDEAVGLLDAEFDEQASSGKIRGNLDIRLGPPATLGWRTSLVVPPISERRSSLFFPTGTLRKLQDPLFDRDMATLGMYQPAAFLDRARTMFYALEEDVSYKIPIIFVHGIDGTAREFESLANSIDRKRFKPWFFYYPSGGDLDQMARFFHNIFLSGDVIAVDRHVPIVIIAHSMGGLIVREALNLLDDGTDNTIHFVSLATPFGGHPAAAKGEKYGPLVLPSWRDLNPESAYIQSLYRRPLPSSATHHLIYAYGNPKRVKFGENSDGVIPLSSQLFPVVQQQATSQVGFNASHAGILRDGDVVSHLLDRLTKVEISYPQEHRDYLLKGGFSVENKKAYTPREIHALRYFGAYMRALVEEDIAPFNDYQIAFLAAVRDEEPAVDHVDSAWKKFVNEYPAWRTLTPAAP